MYYAGLIITDYYREYNDIILKSIINTNINLNLSIFYEKRDRFKTIRELTYHIANVGVELKDNKNVNREDIDIAKFSYDDARYIRREMQLNNEDLYFLYIYIEVYSENQLELEYLLNKIEGLLESNGMQNRRANFRQEQLFLACSPIYENPIELKSAAKKNILTSGIISTYPFITSSIFDETGIFMGTNMYNNSLIFIDRYNRDKYKNGNMVVFGTSGAGKSFFIKLQILRYRLMGITQYVIDPEREYEKICKNLNGVILKIGPSSETYINVFDIREESIEESKGYLSNKIQKLLGFFNLIFTDMKEDIKAILEESIIECYKEKGITFNDNTLYKKLGNKNIFKESKDMPILEDLYNILNKKADTKILALKLKPFINGSLKFFNNYTNVELNNKLIIADIYDLGEENIKYGMYIFIELFWDKIKRERSEEKAIYLDEIWRLIGITSNKDVAGFIYKIFKTIRKYGGTGVAITQDVSDLFSLENGAYGKSILNNSSIKAFFSLEEENINILSENINLSEKEKIEIKSLRKGECMLFVDKDHLLLKIECSNEEEGLIV